MKSSLQLCTVLFFLVSSMLMASDEKHDFSDIASDEAQETSASLNGNGNTPEEAVVNESESSQEIELSEGLALPASDDEADLRNASGVEKAKSPQKPHPLPTVTKKKEGFYNYAIKDRLEVGTRILVFSLDKTKSGDSATRSNTFLGSINELEAQQDYAPIYFFLNYNILPYWGVGISYDTIKVKTLDNGGGDGDFKARGPILYTYLRYPNHTRFTPYGEIGLGFYNIGFDALPEWYEDGKRQFIVDNDIGLVLAAGLDIEVYANWSLDLYIRHVSLDADTNYYFQDPDRLGTPLISTSIPLSHVAYGVGVKYSF